MTSSLPWLLSRFFLLFAIFFAISHPAYSLPEPFEESNFDSNSSQDGERAKNSSHLSGDINRNVIRSLQSLPPANPISMKIGNKDEPFDSDCHQTAPPPPQTECPASDPDEFEPIIVEVDIHIIDLTNEEDIIVVVEDHPDRSSIPQLAGNDQPLIILADDVDLASWWTIEDEDYGFESWYELESFLESQYGTNPHTGIDTSPDTLPIDVEIYVVEDEDFEAGYQNDIDGLEVIPITSFTTSTWGCKQILACQRIEVEGIGKRIVCKNQLLCPNTEWGFEA